MGEIINKEDLFPTTPSRIIPKEQLFPNTPRASESPVQAPSTLQATTPADTIEMGTPEPSYEVIPKDKLFPGGFSPQIQPQVPEEDNNSLKDEEIYTNPDMMAPVRQYMVQKHGQQWADAEKRPDEMVWDTFKTNQRAILSGEVSLIREIVSVRNWDEEQRAIAAQALDVYDKAAPFWEQGVKEGAEAVWDYTRNVLNPFESPSTYLGMGVGSAFTKGASKAVGTAALREAYKRGGKAGMRKFAAEQAKKQATKTALKAGAIAGASDASIAMSSDIAYQKGVEIPLDRKDEIDWGEVALTGAIGALPSGALTTVAGLRKGKGVGVSNSEATKAINQWMKTSTGRAAPAITQSFTTLRSKLPQDVWENMIQDGKLVTRTTEFDDLLFETFMNPGNKDSVVSLMRDNGVRFDFEEGSTTKSIVDYLKNLAPVDKAPMAKAWEDATGMKFDDGLDVLAESASRSGTNFQKISEANKALKASASFNQVVRGALASGKKPKVDEVPKDVLGYVQNNWKQLLVSHPATTAVNIQGWSLASVTRAATDVLKDGLNLKAQATNVTSRARVLSDPLGTKESFKFAKETFAPSRVLSDLNVNFGGVFDKTGSERFALPQNSVTRTIDKTVNFAGRMALVQAQDDWTRAISGFVELERQLSKKYGKSYAEMLKSGQIKELSDPDIWEKVAKTSLEDTFSFDFGVGKDQMAKAANMMGKLSQNSVTGYVFPFGKFMANSLAFTMRHSPLGIMRIAGGMTGLNKKVPLSEVVAEATVGTAVLLGLGAYSHEKMGEGFAWNQVETSTGRVENRENLAPASAYLAIGRWYEMVKNGETPSAELMEDIGKQLIIGEFAGLEQAAAFKAAGKLASYLASADTEEKATAMKEFGEIIAQMGGSIASGFTRPLDAPNDLLGILEAGGASPADMDRRAASGPAERGFLELTRYVDNFLEPFMGEYEDERGNKSLGPTRKSIAHPEGDVKDPNPLGTLAGSKTVPTMHFTNLILGSTNLPEWKQGQRTAIPQFDRFVNEKLAPIVEGRSEALWNNKNFRALSPAQQAAQWKTMVNNVKSELMDKIETGLYEGDPVQPRLLAARAAWAKVPKASKQEALQALEIEGKNDYELTMTDMIRLNEYIELRRKNFLDPLVGK